MHTKFDFSKVEDFDKHIDLSIPNYQGLYDVFRALFMEYMPPQGRCLDIGCSTGKFLNEASRITEGYYTGCDLVKMKEDYNFTFIQGDCLDVLREIKGNNIIVSMFTLQFLGAIKRAKVVEELKRQVDKGSVLLISEKVYCDNPKTNAVLSREYLRQKRKSFTDVEILDKDYSLFGKMYCLDQKEIEAELNDIGVVEQVWQSYNFKGWIVKK